MTKKEVKEIINEVYPKIEKFYGYSKFIPHCTPYVELHHNIYARYSGEEEAQGDEELFRSLQKMVNEVWHQKWKKSIVRSKSVQRCECEECVRCV